LIRGVGEETERAAAREGNPMSIVMTRDGTEIHFKDWGPKEAKPVCFSHAWPLSADAFDELARATTPRPFGTSRTDNKCPELR
jgi:hypothetical protein